MNIDKRVRTSEFMSLLSVGRTKFYRILKLGKTPNPIILNDRDVFWHESPVKKKSKKIKKNLII